MQNQRFLDFAKLLLRKVTGTQHRGKLNRDFEDAKITHNIDSALQTKSL